MPTARLYGSSFTYQRVEKDQYGTYTETTWSDTGNLKYDDGKYAKTSLIASKSGTAPKPGRLIAKGFSGSIPDNSKINSVTVEWEEYIRNPNGGTTAVPNIPARYVCLYYGSSCYSSTKTVSSAVPTSATKRTLTWSSGELPSGFSKSTLTSSSFGAYLNPARNTTYNPGYMYVDHIQLIADYTTPTYSVSITRTGGDKPRDTVTYTFTLTNTNNTPHTVPVACTITFPSDFTVTEASGDGTYTAGSWSAQVKSTSTAVLTVKGYYTGPGSKQVSFQESVTGRSTTDTFTVTNPACDIVQKDYDYVPKGVQAQLTYTATGLGTSSTTVSIPFPGWITVKGYSGDGTYSDGTWTIPAGGSSPRTATITLTVTASSDGVYMQQIKDATNTLRSLRCLITRSDLPNPPIYQVRVPVDRLSEMPWGEKKLYLIFPLQVMKKKTDWLRSGHMYEYSVVADGEILQSFTPSTSQASLVTVRLPDTHVKDLRVYLHMANGLEQDFQYLIADPVISESPVYSGGGGEWRSLVLDDYVAVLEPHGSIGPLELLPVEPDLPDGAIITGFRVSYTLNTTTLAGDGSQGDADVALTLRIHAEDAVYGEKRLIQSTGCYEEGWRYDKWGLVEAATGKLPETEDPSTGAALFTSGWLDEVYVSFIFENPTDSEVVVEVRDVALEIYYSLDDDLGHAVYFNGVPSTSFGAVLLNESELQFGGNLKLDMVALTGWNENYIKSVKIEPISFKLKFYIGGENIEEATRMVREFLSLITPDINRYGLPEPMALTMSWDDTTYYYVLQDEIDVKNHVSGYEVTVPVTVPSGHGYGPMVKMPASGTHKSLIPPRPIVYVDVNEDVKSVTVSERVTQATLTLNTPITAPKTLIIDSDNRRVTDTNGEEYTGRLSLNSEFFTLQRRYDFTASEGATVRMIILREAR